MQSPFQSEGHAGSEGNYFLHLPLVLGGQPFHLLERGGWHSFADAKQNCWISHQVFVSNTRSLPAGPAALLLDARTWSSSIQYQGIQLAAEGLLPSVLPEPALDETPLSPRVAETWTALAGDAGWAGLPLEAFLFNHSFHLELPVKSTSNLALQLLLESQSLLEPKQRWEIPLGMYSWFPERFEHFAWRVNLDSGLEHSSKVRQTYHLKLGELLPPASNRFSQAARTGSWAELRRSDSSSEQNKERSPTIAEQTTPTPETDESYELQPLEAQRRSPQVQPTVSSVKKRTPSAASPSPTPTKTWPIARWTAIAAAIATSGLAAGMWWFWPRSPEFRPAITEARGVAIGNGSPPPAMATGSSGPAEEGSFRSLFTAMATATPDIQIPSKITAEFQVLLKLPANEELVSQLELGLGLPGRFIDLTPIKGPADSDYRKRFKFGPMGGGAEPEVEAELRLQPVATDTDRYSLLLWKWYSQPGPELQAELSLGVLQLATQGKKRELLSLPLSAPQRQQANTLIAAIRDPLPLNPHLEKLVLSSQASDFISWRIGAAQLPRLVPAGKNREAVSWLPPQSPSNPTDYFAPDQAQLRQFLLGKIEPKLRPEGERAVNTVLAQYTPVGIAIRFTPPDSKALARGERQISVIAVLQIRNPEAVDLVFSTNPITDDRVEPSVFQNRFLSEAEAWLSKNLSVPARSSPPGELPENPRSSEEQLTLRAKQLLAIEILGGLHRALESQLKFTVLRRTTIQSSRGPTPIDIPAIVIE